MPQKPSVKMHMQNDDAPSACARAIGLSCTYAYESSLRVLCPPEIENKTEHTHKSRRRTRDNHQGHRGEAEKKKGAGKTSRVGPWGFSEGATGVPWLVLAPKKSVSPQSSCPSSVTRGTQFRVNHLNEISEFQC